MHHTIQLTPFYLEHQLNKEVEQGLNLDTWRGILLNSFMKGDFRKGYREGVKILPLHLEGTGVSIKHKTVTIQPTDTLKAAFASRIEGETPRKKIFIDRTHAELEDAKYVFAVLYNKSVLAEDGDFIESDWGVVTHLTSMTDEVEPMQPETLIANHFQLDGGTSTKMNPRYFEEMLDISVNFWKDKVIANILEVS